MARRGSITIPQPSGLWRRFGALFTDILVLVPFGMIGARLLMLGGWCASLGVFAPLIGLGAAILYTAVLNSRIGGGQTLGKRLLSIQVAGANGQPVSFTRSLGRSVVLWVALAPFPMIRDIAMQSGSTIVVMASLFLAAAIGLGTLYMLLFNRQTRQGLHDLIAGTFVVRKGDAPVVIAEPLRREHWYPLTGLLVLLAAVIALQAPSQRHLADFMLLKHRLRQIEGLHQLRHFHVSGDKVDIGVQLKGAPASFEDVQSQVAGIVFSAYPSIENFQQMEVTVSCNCDLGVLGRMVKWGGALENTRKASVSDWQRLARR